MKGLLAILAPKPKSADEPEPKGKAGGSELEFARLASEASAAGDHDAAAKAMVNAIKACLRSYGPAEGPAE